MEKINEFILKGDNLYVTARSPRDFHQCVIAFFFQFITMDIQKKNLRLALLSLKKVIQLY